MAKAKTWGELRFEQIMKDARERYGRGWSLLSEDQRENYIAAQVLYLVLGQADAKFEPAQALARQVLAVQQAEVDREAREHSPTAMATA